MNLDLDRYRPWLVLLARTHLAGGRLGGKLDAQIDEFIHLLIGTMSKDKLL